MEGKYTTAQGDLATQLTERFGLLLREVDHRLGMLPRLADCFSDYRNPNSVEHSVYDLVAQRVYGLALGYEDLNDHDALRSDSVLALLAASTNSNGSSGRSAPAGRRHGS